MTAPEYEQFKKHLEEQWRIGREFVERACEAQMRALEVIQTLQGGTVRWLFRRRGQGAMRFDVNCCSQMVCIAQ